MPDQPDDPDDPGSRDLDDGLRFLHVMGMQTKVDVLETSVRVLALMEEMIARGQVDLRSLDERRERIRQQEIERSNAQTAVQVGPPGDKYQLTDLPQIDCEARIPLCKGRCCTLTFPLSFQDLDEGVVKWEYKRPYLIKHRPDGYCVHNTAARGCSVYANRPAICRSYDCRNDKRIWTDFENRIPAAWPGDEPPPADPADPQG
ncbi:MAG: YkgJ family cysteine cluster protein [Myxococcota bacterium]|nr:YkgJ family cysteine cluster protein [Myxococcota bacterium]